MNGKRKGILFILLSAIGFFAYKMNGKVKKLKNVYDDCIAFTGKKITYDNEIFTGESMAVIFSGVEIDLTNALLQDEVNILDIHCEFSGVSIKVPKDWDIVLEGNSNKSEIEDKTSHLNDFVNNPKLIIKYNLSYSGVEIKN
ncbi:LiaF domain-containing protein [Natranaerovirga hydrolytica]|uniref:LiaF domain-containing protein n=1 Tax=Natranaerovirga hydrolytica TaxID=680378 RepID=UPI001049D021|nr:LiaF domain-containing protein [Natranaerovirga hydrolytica]